MESVDIINRRLLDYYGRFESTDLPRYRVVWSTDQFEKRWTQHTREGFLLPQPVVKELPKYRQWANDKWILEKCAPIPEFVETDLVEPYSFEPLWVFEYNSGRPMFPKWEAIELIISEVHTAMGQPKGFKKYSNPDDQEAEEKRIQKIKDELFGNETDITDALRMKEGIVVP